MGVSKKKPEKSERIRKGELGPDGRMIGDRLREAMIARGYDPASDQTRLAADCQVLWATGRKNPAIKIKQQNIQGLLANLQASGKYIPIIAAVLKVRAEWLAFGIGMREDPQPQRDQIIREIAAEVLRERRTQ